MALRSEAALEALAGYWLRMQMTHDLWEVRQRGAVRGVRRIAA